MSNWFFNQNRIHETDKSTDETLQTLDRYKGLFLKIFAMLWLTLLISTFSIIVIVRLALSFPTF